MRSHTCLTLSSPRVHTCDTQRHTSGSLARRPAPRPTRRAQCTRVQMVTPRRRDRRRRGRGGWEGCATAAAAAQESMPGNARHASGRRAPCALRCPNRASQSSTCARACRRPRRASPSTGSCRRRRPSSPGVLVSANAETLSGVAVVYLCTFLLCSPSQPSFDSECGVCSLDCNHE